MKLTTPVSFEFSGRKINHQSQLLLAGSCFAENIGHWLQRLGFSAVVNPSGIAYNPVSIARHIDMALKARIPGEEELIETDFGFAHADFHSSLSASSKPDLISILRKALGQHGQSLREANTIFFTFGTAVVFEKVIDGVVVNNCHKLPDNLFRKRYLSESEMFNSFMGALNEIFTHNPDAEVCLTVSPVRHLRHGAIDNLRSKSRLIRLCEMLCESEQRCHYIPVYEYVMDELRDYRFYRYDDLIHLNDAGLEMVQERFEAHYIEPSSAALMDRVKKWQHLKSHRVLHPGSDAATAFEEKLRKETDALGLLLPSLTSRSH